MIPKQVYKCDSQGPSESCVFTVRISRKRSSIYHLICERSSMLNKVTTSFVCTNQVLSVCKISIEVHEIFVCVWSSSAAYFAFWKKKQKKSDDLWSLRWRREVGSFLMEKRKKMTRIFLDASSVLSWISCHINSNRQPPTINTHLRVARWAFFVGLREGEMKRASPVTFSLPLPFIPSKKALWIFWLKRGGKPLLREVFRELRLGPRPKYAFQLWKAIPWWKRSQKSFCLL